MRTPISQQSIFITGGSSGMGLMAAKMLAARGAHIAIFSVDAKTNATSVEEIKAHRASSEQRVAGYLLDVSQRDQVLASFAQASQEIGAPDIVINMAGIGGVATMLDMSFEMFDRIMQINTYGTRHVTEAALQTMVPRKKGKLVLVGSMGGYVPVYGYTAYGASKFAVVGFAGCLRYELKPLGLKVACFCPGQVETPALAAERANTHPATVAMKYIGGSMSMERAITSLIRGIENDTYLIVPGIRTPLVHWAMRLTPTGLWNFITDAIVAHAVRKKK